MSPFLFSLNQVVKLAESGETGKVIARSESLTSEPQYLIRYKNADGRLTEVWWSQSVLEAA